LRLEPKEVDGILVAVRSFDPIARVYLFGSRVDDRKRGGDIDLLVLSESLFPKDESAIDVAIQTAIGERKIDVLVRAREAVTRDPFVAHIFGSALLLG